MIKPLKNILTIILLTSVLLGSYACKTGTDTDNQLLQELNQQLIPLETTPLQLSDQNMSFLDRIADTRIVGLGEATHGTKEFFRMKMRIFQYLVTHHGHRAFGFECDFGESIYVDRYVTDGIGNLDSLMNETMHFWVWHTTEVKELLEWMRQYNIGKSKDEKIHFIGFDCQYHTFQPDLLDQYLSPKIPLLASDVATTLYEIQAFKGTDYEKMEAKTFQSYCDDLEALEVRMEGQKNKLVAASSNQEYLLNRQLLRNFKQTFRGRYIGWHSETASHPRDAYMAQNAQWIAQYMGPGSKISLWAHNGHVCKDPTDSNIGSMGFFLSQAMQDDYRVLGFAFSTGSFTAFKRGSGPIPYTIDENPPENAFSYLFQQASVPNFVLDIRSIPNTSELYFWLSDSRKFLNIGALYAETPSIYYQNLPMTQYFDWMIYFDSTNYAQQLPY